MTLDPRNAIIALFANGVLSAMTEHGTAYVGVMLREDNLDVAQKLKSGWVGLMVLEPPMATANKTISIGGKTIEKTTIIPCSLWVTKKQGMKNPDSYIKSILDTFENAIIDNQIDLDSDTRVVEVSSIQHVPSDSPLLMRRVVMLTAVGYKVRN